SCFMRCTPCSSTGSPTTPHVSSSRRRRLGLDISWDVSVEDRTAGESSRTPLTRTSPTPYKEDGHFLIWSKTRISRFVSQERVNASSFESGAVLYVPLLFSRRRLRSKW